MTISLYELLERVGIPIPLDLSNKEINNITFDSRKVKEGDLFIGLPGEKIDGGIFWPNAISEGAAAAIVGTNAANLRPILDQNILVIESIQSFAGKICSAFWDNPSSKISLIGITGTNGKTTITYLIEYLSKSLGVPSAVFGTLGNRWPGHAENSSYTTLFSDELQEKLFQAVKAGSLIGAMEVSSHALAQKRVAGCKFKGVIFTNLTQDHLDYHSSMDSYFEAKSLLFQEPLFDQASNKAIINIDDIWGQRLAEKLAGRCWRCSLIANGSESRDAELSIKVLETTSLGIKGILKSPLGEGTFSSPLVGDFNLMNLLQAIGSLLQQGFPLQNLLDSIENFPGVPGRMERVKVLDELRELNLPTVLVDYAHTPDALKEALIASRSFSLGKIICVFGCGGDRDRSKRSLMGSIAFSYSDQVILTSDNPRTEDPTQIFNDVISGVTNQDNFFLEPNRSLAIRLAISNAKPEDIVLIAGKGHEDYQILGEKVIYFDDRDQAKKALLSRINS